MKTTLKKSRISKVLLLLLIAGSTITGCKKPPVSPPPTPPATVGIADLVVGDYFGNGLSANGNPFINQIVKVSKVNGTRIKIDNAPGSYPIVAFEADIMQLDSAIINTIADQSSTGNIVVFDLSESPITLAFAPVDTTSSMQQYFGGEKK